MADTPLRLPTSAPVGVSQVDPQTIMEIFANNLVNPAQINRPVIPAQGRSTLPGFTPPAVAPPPPFDPQLVASTARGTSGGAESEGPNLLTGLAGGALTLVGLAKALGVDPGALLGITGEGGSESEKAQGLADAIKAGKVFPGTPIPANSIPTGFVPNPNAGPLTGPGSSTAVGGGAGSPSGPLDIRLPPGGGQGLSSLLGGGVSGIPGTGTSAGAFSSVTPVNPGTAPGVFGGGAPGGGFTSFLQGLNPALASALGIGGVLALSQMTNSPTFDDLNRRINRNLSDLPTGQGGRNLGAVEGPKGLPGGPGATIDEIIRDVTFGGGSIASTEDPGLRAQMTPAVRALADAIPQQRLFGPQDSIRGPIADIIKQHIAETTGVTLDKGSGKPTGNLGR